MVMDEAERVYRPLGEFFDCLPNDRVPILIYPDRVSLNRIFGWGNDESAMGVYWAGVIRILSPRSGWKICRLTTTTGVPGQGPMGPRIHSPAGGLQTAGNYPRWLTEGLAQYAESALLGATRRIDNNSP